jgi:HAD superfamily hydrolase (TIGR01450 family)
MSGPSPTTVEALLERYDLFLLDAYGVLVNMNGALPGAAALLGRIRERGGRLALLSNDASRLPSTTVARYRGFGLELHEDEVLTSGQLLAPYFRQRGLEDVPCIVLGTEDSVRYVQDAGGRAVPYDDERAEVVVVADDDGYPFMEGIEATITTVCRRLDRGLPVELVLPNPDRIYPKSSSSYGLASGSVAMVIEHALRVRYPVSAPRFVGLGKPHGRMFEAALQHLGATARDRAVMLGDQLYTDILGARDFGIDSVLLSTGLTRVDDDLARSDVIPTWLLDGLEPG